jgi:hypothetical protein
VIESRTCFLPMISARSEFLLRLYRHYKSGILPHSGGLLDQPHYYAEAMEILSAIEARIQAEAVAKLRAEAGNRSLH